MVDVNSPFTLLCTFPSRMSMSIEPWAVVFGTSFVSSEDHNKIGVDCCPRVSVFIRTTLLSPELEYGTMSSVGGIFSLLTSVTFCGSFGITLGGFG